ncbi:enoyl-CoA hydratase/isomerase family protein [Mucilaginibacter sp. OK283]|jgi:enoyl-CoA hydratase/carnithine racemase|uniref:enoyl-CoA hydratase/isomerase family protein n=1 Tax=Mucilaginibacter sp. OK283 TaxID=1881049 RepID=UPI0008B43C80|nr:enoyl-CoA hydratase/isomerase family protein [Mucilaginibacter sp. OK283]SEP39628.1 Enoyl-CoA hydratase/carnithine racemase [Mucilaginibacter sp. OK283]
MSTFQTTIQDKLVVITLDRGRSNPINHQMVKELTDCIHKLENDDNVGGVILTGKEGFFSSGIDLIEAYDYDQEQSRGFWIDFLVLQNTLTAFRKPMVAAISGHSPAGGCILAICCDYRVMAAGKFVIGLNEVPVGIIVPDSVFNLYSFWLGRRKAYQYLLEGKLLQVDEALEAGLIDEISAPDSLMKAAVKKITVYMKLNPVTWSESKLNLRKQLISKLKTDQTRTLNKMLEQWWAPATRQGLQMMIQNLKAKNTTAN